MIKLSQRDELVSVNQVNKNALASVAQPVYESWDQSDEENGDPELGFGGICDGVADAMAAELSKIGVECATSYSEYDTHTSVIAQFKEGVFNVDIPPQVYESGFGYNWKKKPNIVFSADNVVIHQIDKNPQNFEQYIGD